MSNESGYYVALVGSIGGGFSAVGPYDNADDPMWEHKYDEVISMPIYNPEQAWNSDLIQFARLIAEMQQAGLLSDMSTDNWTHLCDEMDLSFENLELLIDRACNAWDRAKEKM